MTDTDILRKMTCAPLPSPVLHRTHLITFLQEAVAGTPQKDSTVAGYRLVLLCAPAGYGKTTLLIDFVRQSGFPCCWYLLDQRDSDPVTFLTTLLASIRHRFPHVGAALDPLLVRTHADEADQPASSFEAMIDAISAALADEISERFALMVCNYHEVGKDRTINRLLNRLVQKLPPQCVLVIESRVLPDLDFSSLIVQHKMCSLTRTELRFTAQEIRDLVHLQDGRLLNEGEAEQISRSFDGWIAGILLGTGLGNARILSPYGRVNGAGGLAMLPMGRQHLLAYVVNEVFGSEPALYAFLKEASVLQQMKASLCTALLANADAPEYLRYLERHGLFVTQSEDGPDPTYVCHPVLRDLLCEQLHRQSPERFMTLHRCAAELWRSSYEYDQAIYHASMARAYDVMADLIMEAYEQRLNQGRIETLVPWIDQLPETMVRQSPRLLLIRASIYLAGGDHLHVFPLLDTVSELLTGQYGNSNDILILRAEMNILYSKAWFRKGDYLQSQAFSQQALTQLPIDEISLRAEASMRLGICLSLLGDPLAGITYLQKALYLQGRHTISRQVADVHSALANTYSMVGNSALAEHHLERAIICYDQIGDERSRVNNLIRIGVIKQRGGLFSEAEAYYTQALTLARGPLRLQNEEAYALASLGSYHLEQQRYQQALKFLEEGLALARQLADTYLVNNLLRNLAMTYLLLQDPATAMHLVSEIDVQTSDKEIVSYGQVARDLIYGTVLLHSSRYEEAFISLMQTEAALKRVGLKREQLQASLRLCACQLARGEQPEVLRRLQEIAVLLASQQCYTNLVLLELHHQPKLQQFIKTSPSLQNMREVLQMEDEPKEGGPRSTAAPVLIAKHQRITMLALGEPTILLDEKPVTRWRMARSLELFFLLLDNARPMRTEQIINALWSEADERASQTVHLAVHHLRQVLGASSVVSHAGTYKLNLASLYKEIYYDVRAFQGFHIKAKQALAQEDDEAARTALTRMVDLYRGDYLQSFYSDWPAHRRDELRSIFLDAHHHLAQIAWRAEQFEESILHWKHMLAIDSCLESAHYGLMLCYLRLGKREAALRQYQRCKNILQAELAVPPGTAIQKLYQHLMHSSKNGEAKREHFTPMKPPEDSRTSRAR